MASLSNFEFFKILLPGMYEEAQRLPVKFAPVLGARRDLKLRLAGGDMMPLWDMEVFVDEKKGDVYLRKGWKKFARAYDLRNGYVLFFRYDDGRGDLTVTVFDLTTCRRWYVYVAVHPKPLVRAAAWSRTETNIKPSAPQAAAQTPPPADPRSHFAVTIRQCNLEAKQNQYLNVPVEFQDAHGYVRRRRVELQMGGRSWTVNLKGSERVLGDRSAFKYGWHQFCVDNGIEVGDVCFFRVIREGSGCRDDDDEEWEQEEEDDEHVLKVEVRKKNGTFVS